VSATAELEAELERLKDECNARARLLGTLEEQRVIEADPLRRFQMDREFDRETRLYERGLEEVRRLDRAVNEHRFLAAVRTLDYTMQRRGLKQLLGDEEDRQRVVGCLLRGAPERGLYWVASCFLQQIPSRGGPKVVRHKFGSGWAKDDMDSLLERLRRQLGVPPGPRDALFEGIVRKVAMQRETSSVVFLFDGVQELGHAALEALVDEFWAKLHRALPPPTRRTWVMALFLWHETTADGDSPTCASLTCLPPLKDFDETAVQTWIDHVDLALPAALMAPRFAEDVVRTTAGQPEKVFSEICRSYGCEYDSVANLWWPQ
jgi:hypothetical protein